MSAAYYNTVCVIGLGYIGLPTAAVLANAGIKVHGVDHSARVVDIVNAGGIHIEEANLDILVQSAVTAGALEASRVPKTCETFLIAVPTPLTPDYNADLRFVFDAVDAIGPYLSTGCKIVLESTCPVGTTRQVAARIAQQRPDLAVPGYCDGPADLAIAYCPERVLPGKIIEELVSNDRVIGGMTPACAEKVAEFYRRFVEGQCLCSEAGVAEMVKLSENSFRDVNIAFANELSLVAEAMDINVWEVIRLANRHPRVAILNPGPGVGGHCIAVDPWFLVSSAPQSTRLIRAAREVNDHKAVHVGNRLKAMLNAAPDARLAVLGLAFKPNIDDFRQSPAMKIAQDLADYGDRLMIVEPFANQLPSALADCGAKLCEMDEAMEACELVAVLVDHELFKRIPPTVYQGKILYDTRGMWTA
ncbi:MAG: UDP-N-acetyl-D-mannosamine dehydrogenase [Erythrobacter sp.]|nr:UDP-N-acetyl-D-mannosamine dehydrogenase [Erythrobacter sp.]RZV34837.1 MAG: UDP-N-acetyl-D-mannosamine dehydrogenase [Sphingomonadaceae bacterium]